MAKQRQENTEKINDLIKDINRNGMLKGIGQPELLKHGLSGYFSRRIGKKRYLVHKPRSYYWI